MAVEGVHLHERRPSRVTHVADRRGRRTGAGLDVDVDRGRRERLGPPRVGDHLLGPVPDGGQVGELSTAPGQRTVLGRVDGELVGVGRVGMVG